MKIIKIFFVFLVLVLISSCTDQLVQKKESMMDTDVTIAASQKDAALIEPAFDEIRRIDSLMSNFKNDSEVYLLNENHLLKDPDLELAYVMKRSVYYSEISGEAFDITVQPLLDLYTKSFSEKNMPPTEEEIKETLNLVGYDKIMISEKNISLEDGMKITLGGIAKGYAVDKAAEMLIAKGVGSALINAGGDIRVVGSKDDSPFRVAIANPDDPSDYIAILDLKDVSVATSGNYERYFDPEKKAHHIMDPKTGKSALGVISVTVIAKTAIDADALATAVFVMGPEKGIRLIESLDDTECLIIDEDRNIIRSSGMRDYEE